MVAKTYILLILFPILSLSIESNEFLSIPSECIQNGYPCDNNGVCCDQLDCTATRGGDFCQPPMCYGEGKKCEDSKDCCGDLECSSNICTKCVSESRACGSDLDCCNGLTCQEGSCQLICRPRYYGCDLNKSNQCCDGLDCIQTSSIIPGGLAQCGYKNCIERGNVCSHSSQCCPDLSCKSGRTFDICK